MCAEKARELYEKEGGEPVFIYKLDHRQTFKFTEAILTTKAICGCSIPA